MGHPSEDQQPQVPGEYVPDFPLDKLLPHPENVRVHDEESLRISLKANGHYKPLVVQRSTGYVLVGNGTRKVLIEHFGRATAGVFLIDVDDAAAKKIMLADNPLGEKGTYRFDALADLLAEYADEGAEGFAGTGYDLADYEALRAEREAAASVAAPAPRAAVRADHGFDDETGDGRDEEDGPVDEPEPEEPARVVLEFGDTSDAAEFRRLTRAAGSVLRTGEDMVPTEQLALRGLRVLVSCLDHRHEFGAVDMATLLRAADVAREVQQ